MKVLTLVFKCLHNQVPSYLRKLLTEQEIRKQSLRSTNNTRQLQLPWTTRQTFGSRSFSIAGPILWNRQPGQLRRIDKSISFKQQLKTHYFKITFNK